VSHWEIVIYDKNSEEPRQKAPIPQVRQVRRARASRYARECVPTGRQVLVAIYIRVGYEIG
jgi:hypothetical protein